MTDSCVFLLALSGFMSLLWSMRRHQHDWFDGALSHRHSRLLRLCGFGFIAAAFAVAGAGAGGGAGERAAVGAGAVWGYAAVSWFGWLTVAATLAVTAQTNSARLRRIIRRSRFPS